MKYQRKKNIKLFGILLLLIIVITAFSLFDTSKNALDVDRDLFAVVDATRIDKVVFNRPDQDSFSLEFTGSNWFIDNASSYQADPQRLKVLFAILKQVRVRRPVSQQREDSVSKAINERGVTATLYSGNEIEKKIMSVGDESSGITYMKLAGDEEIFIVEIPGYRSYLHGIFNVDKLGWRDPLIYDINWRNMQSVDMIYSENDNSSFRVIFDDRAYAIEGIQKTDTTKLFDYLDNVSQLYVDDYLAVEEVEKYIENTNPTISIIVTDVGNNYASLELIKELKDQNQYLIRVDSTDYALLSKNQVSPILKRKKFFSEVEE